MANWDAPISFRKAQIRWGRTSGAAAGEDDAVTTHHFVKVAGGVVVDTWLTADFQAIETAFATAWGAIKENFYSTQVYKQMRWYRVVPRTAPGQGQSAEAAYGAELSGPPVRIIDPAVAGTGSSAGYPPPQVSISVTEKTSDPRSWGRFYLPGPLLTTTTITSNGRWASALQTDLADAFDTFYEACITAGVPAVVFSSAQPARTRASGTTMPARGPRALGVTELQVDDIPDVIRSRRWKEPLLRTQRAIAGS